MIFEATLSLLAVGFICYAWKTSAKAQTQNQLLSILGMMLATFCVLPRFSLLLDRLVIERYWHQPLPPAWQVVKYWLIPTTSQCMWLVPLSAVASCMFLGVSRKEGRFWGMSAALLGWISLWV